MDDPRHNYIKVIESAFERIRIKEVLMLRIFIDQSAYGGRLRGSTFTSKWLWITASEQSHQTLDYRLSYLGIIFKKSFYHDKYDVYECHLDEALLQQPH